MVGLPLSLALFYSHKSGHGWTRWEWTSNGFFYPLGFGCLACHFELRDMMRHARSKYSSLKFHREGTGKERSLLSSFHGTIKWEWGRKQVFFAASLWHVKDYFTGEIFRAFQLWLSINKIFSKLTLFSKSIIPVWLSCTLSWWLHQTLLSWVAYQ